MSFIVTLEMHVAPETSGQLKTFLKEFLKETRAFEGCRSIEVFGVTQGVGTVVIRGLWESQSHFDKYQAWRAENGTLEPLLAMFAAPLRVQYLEKLDI